jgi:hypothetical protein
MANDAKSLMETNMGNNPSKSLSLKKMSSSGSAGKTWNLMGFGL